MKKIIFIAGLNFLTLFCFSQQENADDDFPDSSFVVNTEHAVVKQQQKANNINAEKLAWELMRPYGYRKPEKTAEMKSYEEMLIKMRTGVAELSLVMGAFEMRSFGKTAKNKKK